MKKKKRIETVFFSVFSSKNRVRAFNLQKAEWLESWSRRIMITNKFESRNANGCGCACRFIYYPTLVFEEKTEIVIGETARCREMPNNKSWFLYV